jgi:WD repeat-containing protein 48
MEIEGVPAIKQATILSNKRHVLTKDTKGNVQLYDALLATKVEDLGPVDFEEEIKRRNVSVFIPSWFTVGLHTSVSYFSNLQIIQSMS